MKAMGTEVRLKEQQLKAFLALRGGDVHQALEEQLAAVQDTLVSSQDGTIVRQLQGDARRIKDILSLIDGTSRQHATPGKRR